jgi:hypothetical protein
LEKVNERLEQLKVSRATLVSIAKDFDENDCQGVGCDACPLHVRYNDKCLGCVLKDLAEKLVPQEVSLTVRVTVQPDKIDSIASLVGQALDGMEGIEVNDVEVNE